MNTPSRKQQRLQIILAVIIGLTLPCYGLGFLFVSINRRGAPTATPRLTEASSATPEPRIIATATAIIPTRFPTFTPTLSPTATLTSTATLTPSPTATSTDTPTVTATPTITPSFTSSATEEPPQDTETPTATQSGG